MKAAIRDEIIPCVFSEHKYLYRRIKEEVPADDYVVPIGRARVAREGRDLSIITYAAMVHTALEAADICGERRNRHLDCRSAVAGADQSRGHRADGERTNNKVISSCTSTRVREALQEKMRPSSTKKRLMISMGRIVRIPGLDSAIPFLRLTGASLFTERWRMWCVQHAG